MVEPRAVEEAYLAHRDSPTSPAHSSVSDAISDASADLFSQPAALSLSPLTLRADAELLILLSSLPSKMDLEAMVHRIEEAHK